MGCLTDATTLVMECVAFPQQSPVRVTLLTPNPSIMGAPARPHQCLSWDADTHRHLFRLAGHPQQAGPPPPRHPPMPASPGGPLPLGQTLPAPLPPKGTPQRFSPPGACLKTVIPREAPCSSPSNSVSTFRSVDLSVHTRSTSTFKMYAFLLAAYEVSMHMFVGLQACSLSIFRSNSVLNMCHLICRIYLYVY